MARITELDLDNKFSCKRSFVISTQTGKKINLKVTKSTIHVAVNKNNTTIHNNDYGADSQGVSDFAETTVDAGQWSVEVTGNASSKFSMSLPD